MADDARPGSTPPVILKLINLDRKPHSIPEVTGVVSLVLENPQENTTFPSPNMYTPPQQLRGVMHNDQLQDYSEFSGCLPSAVTCVGFDNNGLAGPFSLQQVARSGLCFNHPLIELVRQ